MTNETLALEIGDTLQMQFLTSVGDERHYVKVMGYAVDKSVLVVAPRVNGRYLEVREGEKIVARLMVGNDVVGFSGKVLRVCSNPYRYLHLSYPKDMQAITVRKALRVNISMIASVRSSLENGGFDRDALAQSVTIEDLSTTGALFTSPDILGDVGDNISITMRINVAGSDDNIMIPAIIRNVRETEVIAGEEEIFYHGVELKLSERKDSVLLHAFVYEQIARSHE